MPCVVTLISHWMYSTSGSDSENDTFSWKTMKRVKAKRKKSLLSVGSTNTTSPYLSHPKTAATVAAYASPLLEQVKFPKAGRCGHHSTEQQHSAPATHSLTHSFKYKLPPSQKFVNKYQDRSNGGIPIFSEERLKERRDKVCNIYIVIH